jgi:2-haloalkanoic acid dehalogenase type II
MTGPDSPHGCGAVLFDLLTALLDSWSLWSDVAGSASAGRAWREEYLTLTYAAGDYRPYESLVAEAAGRQGLSRHLATRLIARWDELQPWPEAPAVVRAVAESARIGVVTNCSTDLGRRAAARIGVPFDVVVTAESAGAYKPRREPYQRALAELGLPAGRVLFVAGSRYDIPGAMAAGMPVWWHNRVGMPRDGAAVPVAEHDSLSLLPRYVAGHPANPAPGRAAPFPGQAPGRLPGESL